MKSNNNNIRKNACQLILFYRSMYKECRDNLITVNIYVIDKMYDHYLMLRGLYNCELVSVDTINRAYYMFVEILKIKIRSER